MRSTLFVCALLALACTGGPNADRDKDGFTAEEDCDDDDPRTFPRAPDAVGDDVDQDCDGVDGTDSDEDGYASVASGGDDCDDRDDGTHPDAADAHGDDADTNCDGTDGTDADGDGIAGPPGPDCDDADPTTRPGAPDTVGDGLDTDCDGADGADRDGDGYASIASGGDDCDDGDPSVNPAAVELPGDGVDNDCQGGDLDAFEPYAFFVSGNFGYDPATKQAVAYTDPAGDTVNPTLVMVVAEEAYFIAGDDRYTCVVLIEEPGPRPPGSWVARAGVAFGFDFGSSAVAETDCEGWDPTVWGSDPLLAVTGWRWGLGVGALDPDVRDTLRDQIGLSAWNAQWAPYVVGGGFYWDLADDGSGEFPGGFVDVGYGAGYEVDAARRVKVDAAGDAIRLLASDVTDGTLPGGAYVVRAVFGLDATFLAP